MDIATIVGVLGGFALMVVALFMAGSHGGHGVALGQFIDPPALVMVLGGGLCVVLTSVPLMVFFEFPKVLLRLVRNRTEDLPGLIETMTRLSEISRRDGLLALESQLPLIEHPTLRLGVQMVVDGTRPEVVEDVVSTAIKSCQMRHYAGRRMVELLGKCGPAFGMIATLLGLILMLGNLNDPNAIGPSMALALVGTLYGTVMANLVCNPCAEKLGYLSQQELLAQEIVLRGLLAIQSGDNPRIVEQKLSTYLPFKQRTEYQHKVA